MARHLALHLALLAAFGWSLLATGCAVTLRAPTPDALQARPVAAPTSLGSLSMSVRLTADTIAAWLDDASAEPTRYGQTAAMVGRWSLEVRRQGPARVWADGERLCVALPFAGDGQIEVLGQRLQRSVSAGLRVCARPRVRPDAHLTLTDVIIGVELDRSRMELATRVLVETMARHLGEIVAKATQARVEALAVPIAPLIQPRLAALHRPWDLGEGACLRIRPERIWIGQPVVEEAALRLPLRLDARPSAELPCAAAPATAEARQEPVAIAGDPDLRVIDLRLRLPIGVSLRSMEPELAKALAARGRIATDGGGWVRVGAARLDSAGGAVLVRADVAGALRGRVLGLIPVERDVRGEVLFWGRPTLRADHVEIDAPVLDVRSDDRVTELVAALQREELAAATARASRVPTAPLLARADAMLRKLGEGVDVGGQRLPIRVDRKSLTLVAARAVDGRLVVEAEFIGHIVIGEVEGVAPRARPR